MGERAVGGREVRGGELRRGRGKPGITCLGLLPVFPFGSRSGVVMWKGCARVCVCVCVCVCVRVCVTQIHNQKSRI